MLYTIYKITNILNGKTYIGKHQTENPDDDYFGSGKRLKRAIIKYGIENFTKEILHVFDNEQDMNAKEAELVTEEFCNREDTYNLCPGGNGGFGYINSLPNSTELKRQAALCANSKSNASQKATKSLVEKWKTDTEFRNRETNRLSQYPKNNFEGKAHTLEWKQNHSAFMKKMTGEKSSQYGSKWITNGIENKKIKAVDIVPEDWYYGRKLNATVP